ncbi:acyl-CoA acyltransferase [Deinococcus irradiatisoli]|uniref:Acyl-CoA acyltransferase n=1 Tax=Deinococcus irradiatisoli TaxID=2202254 RepID=A0A2Z3JEF6_9DEIO|nr:GNAT family N-acetyltransferase [Deinococcus irradiatisoli]AWN23422.1 acyl-CoA acyltransferase [Deinococcus irradiatisoli]
MPDFSAFVIRDLHTAQEMVVLEDLQRAAWGYSDTEVHPSNIFRIHAHVGGVVAAAFPASPEGEASGEAFGFVYGFPAYRDGRAWHHSHMLALRPEWRGSGAAAALKYHQAQRAREMNLDTVTWTFDPLVARNARFNLGKLGARAVSYHPEWYATRGLPADRLMVEWQIGESATERADRPRPAAVVGGRRVLEAAGLGPGTPELSADVPLLLAEVPLDAFSLPAPLPLAWRLALRQVLGQYLTVGYVISDLVREGERAFYLLEAGASV